MDRINKFILILTFTGIITLSIGSSYIPPTGGTVPSDKTLEEFNEQQRQVIYSSIGFKVTMTGVVMTITGLVLLCIRAHIADVRNIPPISNTREIKSIMKVKRAAILPEEAIKVVVEDPKPQVRTTPNFGATTAPAISSSPPAQLVPSNQVGPVIQYVTWPGPMNGKLSGNLKRTFKYPPPYDAFNR